MSFYGQKLNIVEKRKKEKKESCKTNLRKIFNRFPGQFHNRTGFLEQTGIRNAFQAWYHRPFRG